MPQQLSNRDLLDIAINGSKQFHEKTASANGNIQPDPVTDGHREMTIQLNGLAALLNKTAEYVKSGYPVRTALGHVATEAGIDPTFTEKVASCIDELGDLVLKEIVVETFQNKVREKTAQSPPQDRVQSSVKRLAELGVHLKR